MNIDSKKILDGEYPEHLKNKDKKGDYNVDVLKDEVEKTDKGLVVVNWQTETGKTYSALEVGKEHVENGETVLMIVPGQKLGKEIEEKLADKHGLDESKINRIKGFERASDLYPAEEEENANKKMLPEEGWTETQKKVYEDREMGQKPLKIVRKYRDELDEDEWRTQFSEKEEKFVIAPIEYLKHRKLKEIRKEAELTINDEDIIMSEEEIEWDGDISSIENFASELFDNRKDEIKEAMSEAQNQGFKSNITDVNELEETIFDDNGFIDWLKELEEQLKKFSAAFRMDFDELGTVMEEENREESIVRTVNKFSMLENKLYSNQYDVELIIYVLNKARNEIYFNEENPSQYRSLFENVPKLSTVSKFSDIARYEEIKYQERPVEWKKNKRRTNNFEESKEVEKEDENFEAGFIKVKGEMKPYRKEGDTVKVFERVIEQGQKQPYFVYAKPVAFKLFDEMKDKPVVLTDASFKEVYLDVTTEQYAKYKARVYDVNIPDKKWNEVINDKMDELDYWAFHNSENKTSYYPASDFDNFDENFSDAVPESDIQIRITETDVQAKNTTVTRLTKQLANKKKGRFAKSSLELDNISNLIDLIKYSSKEYAVISFKDEIERLREEYNYFDENNTEYYGNLRGTNNLEGKNLVVIGTAMTNLNRFREFMIYLGFDREDIMNPIKEDGKYKYDNPKIQALYEAHTEEIMYQAIQRARGMTHNLEIYVLGIVPDKIKNEYKYKEGKIGDFIEKTIIEENGGIQKLVEKALDEGLTIEDIQIDEEVEKARYHSILTKLRDEHEDLVLKQGENRHDRELGTHEHKKNTRKRYREIVELIEDNPDKVEDMTTTEFKNYVNSELNISQGFMDKDFFERLKENEIAERNKHDFTSPKKMKII
ncbi:MAG: hypothetical protein ABEJ98_03550 [Candidatus Nanohaloarchaea archaeon]